MTIFVEIFYDSVVGGEAIYMYECKDKRGPGYEYTEREWNLFTATISQMYPSTVPPALWPSSEDLLYSPSP